MLDVQIEPSGPRMGFVGVTTGSSSIMEIFPRWAEALGLPTRQLQGHDVALDASATVYRDLIDYMTADPDYLGALVTSHKISVYDAAKDMFDDIDHFGRLCGEISSISKHDGRLLGHAKDPITADLAMTEFLAPRHFTERKAQVLCLGSGGAAAAITWCLQERVDRPDRVICTDVSQTRLDRLAAMHNDRDLDPELFSYVLVDGPADAYLEDLPPGSLVINATGLGKDRPGSPLTSTAHYPQGAIVWELNYRGELDMLRAARAQEASRGLTIVDGWRYFIHGWTQVIAEVFRLDMPSEQVDQLSGIAARVVGRP